MPRKRFFNPLDPPERLLLGPGPSNVAPEVSQALSKPVIGHLDPAFLEIMNDTMELLRFVFETRNPLTLPMSGTGSAGMEAAFVNFVEEGDPVVIGVNGLFGQRMAEVATRAGARVTTVDAPWGQPLDAGDMVRAIDRLKPKIVAVVHAETSTGVLQPLDEIAQAAHEAGALFLVDSVTSLGGQPVRVDLHGIDIAYSGTQKCLSCPPGLAPLTVSERAAGVLKARRSPVQSWYLDLGMLTSYWGEERFYHHTAPVNMIYGLRAALGRIHAEGLDQVWQRHTVNGQALQSGLIAMGLELLAPDGYRAPMLTAVRIPSGVDDLRVRRFLLEHHDIEIGGGLGPLKGQIWRIGLMGHNAQPKNVIRLLTALERALLVEGFPVEPGAGAQAAERIYGGAEGIYRQI